MEQFLSGVSRASIIRWTAIYLVIDVVVNACGGLVFGIAGAVAAGASAMTAASGIDNPDVAAATTQLAGIGGLSIVLALLYIISVPIFAVAAFGLWRRKSWARMGAVIALGFSILLSALSLNNGLGGIIWILISGFGVYLFWTDAGIKQELSR